MTPKEKELRELISQQPVGTFCTVGVTPQIEDDDGVLLFKKDQNDWVTLDVDSYYNGHHRNDLQVANLLELWDHPWSFS